MVGQYAQGNEPSHHIAYLYAYAGAPWKAQRVLRGIMDDLFTSRPDGLCGNEDCGQMSAWYVMSALGFYPVTPGSDVLVFGTPMFRNAVIHLENGKDFVLEAPKASHDAKYIRSISVDGAAPASALVPLRHADIVKGARVVVDMSDRPVR
jgi:predicted alpha-1,2-mannosidase